MLCSESYLKINPNNYETKNTLHHLCNHAVVFLRNRIKAFRQPGLGILYKNECDHEGCQISFFTYHSDNNL